jgi:predicted nucleotide-binding protein
VAEKALQFRARQNVILELGFFYGQLAHLIHEGVRNKMMGSDEAVGLA